MYVIKMVTPPIFMFVPYHNEENPSLFSKRWRKIIQHDTALHGYSISDPQAAQLHLHSMASTPENRYNQHHCLAPGSLAKVQQCQPVSAARNTWLSQDMQWPFLPHTSLFQIFSPQPSRLLLCQAYTCVFPPISSHRPLRSRSRSRDLQATGWKPLI